MQRGFRKGDTNASVPSAPQEAGILVDFATRQIPSSFVVDAPMSAPFRGERVLRALRIQPLVT